MKNKFISDANGVPVTFYHYAEKEFDHFNTRCDFGTKQFAIDSRSQSGLGHIIPVNLKINNALIAPDLRSFQGFNLRQLILNLMLHRHIPKPLLKKHPILKKHNVLSVFIEYAQFKEILDKINIDKDIKFVYPAISEKRAKLEMSLASLFPAGSGSIMSQRFTRYMQGQGYDAISYTNVLEDKGSLTYVPFHTMQIKRLDKNTSPIAMPDNSDFLDFIEASGSKKMDPFASKFSHHDYEPQSNYQKALWHELIGRGINY